MTNYQIKEVFYKKNKSIKNCNRRLAILFHEMYCIDRYFPPVDDGSSRQHLFLDRAGAMVINLDRFYKLNTPPLRWKHHILVTEFDIKAYNKGYGWGRLEHKIANQQADLYYPNYRIVVEIDTGSECHQTLLDKINGYNRTANLKYLIFVTDGGENRVNLWKENVRKGIKFAGCKFEDVDELLDIIKKR